jgi:LysR family hydrogen peroxide-inducible transcriptional activator
MTLRDLEYVTATAESLHFGRAARRVGISQPTLSAQIRKVEAWLKFPVFERTKRSVRLTERGAVVVAQMRIVLDEAKKIAELASETRAPLTGGFRLGAIATLGPYFLPHVLGPLRKAYPGLELTLREGLTDGLLEELKRGRLDAVLAAPTFDPSGLALDPVFFEPFRVLVPAGHPFQKTHPGTRDLNPEEMVLLEDGHCLKDQILDLCPVNRRGRVRQFHATSLETLKQLVAIGQGYTLIPELATRLDPGLASLLRMVPFKGGRDSAPGRSIVLVSRSRADRSVDLHELAAFFRKHRPLGTLPARNEGDGTGRTPSEK